MRLHVLVLILLGVPSGGAMLHAGTGGEVESLENGSIRIGVDLGIGGTITHLSRASDNRNLINSHDLGRQVQQSYYAGPQPFGDPHPSWPNWPWNPIGSGDVYGNPARVIDHRNDGKSLYVKTIPMQWALNNVPGECTFETWITLEGASARVRCRLTNDRPDTNPYPARNQELPAVYTVGTLHRLITYNGDRPFEREPVLPIENSGPPWEHWTATENWAALVDDDDWGVGVTHPGVYSFIGGFHGTPNVGGPKDDPTGYIAPVRREILDHNIVYEYEYILTVGTLDEIRAVAVANRVRDNRPDYRFDGTRQHWTYRNARDAVFPPDKGVLNITTTGDDPQFIGPEQWWRAEDVPKLFVRAAFPRAGRATLFWSVPDNDFSAERSASFEVDPNAGLRTYEVDLEGARGYQGTITGLRLDPPDSTARGDEVRLDFLSWRSD